MAIQRSMARGIAESDVHATADEIVGAGERPTVERIRAHLGIHAFGAAFIVGVIFSVCVYALALVSTAAGEGIR